MIRSARILTTHCTDPHKNLALEEVLLTTLPEDQAVLYLWQNRHTVVIGAGQNACAECRVGLLESEGGTLARRSSGGGAVYHDMGNLNFSFLVPRADYDVARQLKVILEAVRALGVEAEPSGRNDLTAGGRKFSGNAFRILKDGALHHGTLLVNVDMGLIGRYLNVSKDKLRAKGREKRARAGGEPLGTLPRRHSGYDAAGGDRGVRGGIRPRAGGKRGRPAAGRGALGALPERGLELRKAAGGRSVAFQPVPLGRRGRKCFR